MKCQACGNKSKQCATVRDVYHCEHNPLNKADSKTKIVEINER